MLAWEPDKGTHFGVIPRDGTAADVKWYTMESRFMFHMMNAWTDGTKLHADVTGANATQFAPKLDGSMAKPSDGVAPTFRRWSIDLADNSATIKEELLDDIACEFPRTDDRLMTKPYRHGYAAGTTAQAMASFNHIIHFDKLTGARQTYTPGDDYMLGEAVFAPRRGGTTKPTATSSRSRSIRRRNKSELMILDAQNVEAGPSLPRKCRCGFRRASTAAGLGRTEGLANSVTMHDCRDRCSECTEYRSGWATGDRCSGPAKGEAPPHRSPVALSTSNVAPSFEDRIRHRRCQAPAVTYWMQRLVPGTGLS